MKKPLTFLLLLMIISCGKETQESGKISYEISEVLSYDTIAIDSFSPGATSVDVARRIKISSQNYQDSLKKIAEKVESEKILAKAKEEQEKLSKKLDEEKKKAAAEKAKSEIKQVTPEKSESNTIPNL